MPAKEESGCMGDLQDESGISDITKVLKALSEPIRLMILEKIAEGIQCNCELGSALNIAPNLISHHLSVLRKAGLIETTRSNQDAR